MKKVQLLFGLFFLVTMVMYSQEFKFEEETIDYGKIEFGSEGMRTFEFTNVGNAPLIINQVKSSCGCAVPKKPEDPIMPGEKGEITVAYDTKRQGVFSKAIIVYSNANTERKSLKIKGVVVK